MCVTLPPHHYTKNPFAPTHADTTAIFLPRLCSQTHTRFAMDAMSEQRAALRFCLRRANHSCTEAYEMPDLAPCDFFLFPQLKKKLRGRRFQSGILYASVHGLPVAIKTTAL